MLRRQTDVYSKWILHTIANWCAHNTFTEFACLQPRHDYIYIFQGHYCYFSTHYHECMVVTESGYKTKIAALW